MTEAIGATLGGITASADPAPARALRLLTALRSAVPFDAAWLASTAPRGVLAPLAALDLDDDVLAYLAGPGTAQDVAATGDRHPLSRWEQRRPAGGPSAWSDCLTPAGFHESLSLPLHSRGGRRVGFLLLLFTDPAPPARAARRRLADLVSVLAPGVDPMSGLVAAARLVPEVSAGAVLLDDGSTEALPGLDADPLLVSGSPVLAVARQLLDDGLCLSSFLWPLGGSFAPAGHVQVTVVTRPADSPDFLLGMVLISPAQDLRGLTPRELEVLGLVILGHSNQQIASALVVAPRTAAAHVEHVLAKLDASTRTTAAVRAEREGLYVPPLPRAPTSTGTPPAGRRA